MMAGVPFCANVVENYYLTGSIPRYPGAVDVFGQIDLLPN